MPNAPKRPFHTASDADIKRGEVSDVYFSRTVQILTHRGDRKRVKAEIYLKSLPEDWQWGILAGVEEAGGPRAGGARARGREQRRPCGGGRRWGGGPRDGGALLEPYQPVVRIEGTYVEW